jgi:hypothetical protein
MSGKAKDWSPFVGRRFGKWTVLSIEKKKAKRGHGRVFKSQCECGTIHIHPPQMLLRGDSKSCGCGNRKGEDIAFNMFWLKIKYDASARNLAFELTEEEVRKLASSNCAYCGDSPQTVTRHRNHTYRRNGIDRVDNNVGYTSANSVPCCKTCNRMKSAFSASFFRRHAEKIYWRGKMVSDNYVKSQLISVAWDAASHISFPAMAAVMFCIKNRVDANGDGDWLKVISAISKEKTPAVDVRDPDFQKVLEVVDHIYDGSKVDRWTNGGTHWEAGDARERTAVVGTLEIYK